MRLERYEKLAYLRHFSVKATGRRTEGNSNLTWTNKFSDDMLESSLIIADTLEKGFIILICTGEYKGVYYWDDSYHFESSEDDKNTYFIADSFSDLLTLINECKNK
ncbi:MAG: hypothetical protein E7249_00110 [Paenibacillaceae bacterium]|nr:hypothetical protein [Paenibacillaceae bacterium]